MKNEIRVFALVASACLFSAAPARTDDAQEPEDPRRELRQLKAQMTALKSALSEAAEYERMRAGAMARAMKIIGGEVAASAEDAPVRPRAAARTSSAAPRAPTPAPVPSAPPPLGGVRGHVDVPGGEPVAYVYVENIRGPVVPGRVKIEQVHKQFVPAWAVVQRGTTIAFPNLDNVYHNVFSLSSGNTFDLGLYSAAENGKEHTFNEAGAVDVYCNIHPQMAASVLVVPNRYFAKVKADGSFEIPSVPSGRRRTVAWAPGTRLAAEWVEVSAGRDAEVKFKLEPRSAGHRNKDGRPYGSYE
jgi:plastocyanin